MKTWRLLLVGLLSIGLLFHQGRTDSNGGHRHKASGTYHYHHGQPAHTHYPDNKPDDWCPYRDATPEPTATPEATTSNEWLNQTNTPGTTVTYTPTVTSSPYEELPHVETEKTKASQVSARDIVGCFMLAIAAILIIWIFRKGEVAMSKKKILVIAGIVILFMAPIIIHAIQAQGELCQPAKWLKLWVGILFVILGLYVCFSDFLGSERRYKFGGTRAVAMVFLFFYITGWMQGEYLFLPDERMLTYFVCSIIVLAWYEGLKSEGE